MSWLSCAKTTVTGGQPFVVLVALVAFGGTHFGP